MGGTNEERAERLTRVIVAAISGDHSQMQDVFTRDVIATGPGMRVASREQLVRELERRLGAFSERKVSVAPLDVAGDRACVEWVASGTHSGPFSLDDGGGTIAPTGRRVRLRAITVAEFDGDQICSIRSYWDGAAPLEDADT